eukprot:SAG31_NODE_34526_length_332_cov_0.669528_1_plen_38_part_10
MILFVIYVTEPGREAVKKEAMMEKEKEKKPPAPTPILL